MTLQLLDHAFGEGDDTLAAGSRVRQWLFYILKESAKQILVVQQLSLVSTCAALRDAMRVA